MERSSRVGHSCKSTSSKKKAKSERPTVDYSYMRSDCTDSAGSGQCSDQSEAVLSARPSEDDGSSTMLADANMWLLPPNELSASSCSQARSMLLDSTSLPFTNEALGETDADEHSRPTSIRGHLPSPPSPPLTAGLREQEVNECPICKLKFKHKCHLSRHLKQHTGMTRYSCSVCGREFDRKDCLNKHLRIHSGTRPYPCDVCGKTFPEMASLKRHVTVHSDKKPYHCDECGRSYSQSDCLKRHLLTHGGQTQPYACDHCGLRFTLPSRLRDHVLTHTGVKPYPCDVCGRRYSRAEYVKQHKRVLHADLYGTIELTEAG